ncbi:MAG: energy transducer TonB [Lysobacteraceae bacterium]
MAALITAGFFGNTADAADLRKQTELGMVVTGTIDIRADGSVDRYAIDEADKVPAAVRGILDRQVPAWKFEPAIVDGKPVPVHTSATIRLLAKPLDDGGYAAGIQSVGFFGGGTDDGGRISIRERAPPVQFPSFGAVFGMSGDVYVALKIGRDGRVLDAIVQKVNLTAGASDRQMARARKSFADATLAAVRQWTFNVSSRGKWADLPYRTGVLPVIFHAPGDEEIYGKWRPDLPGPCAEAPWPDEDGDASHDHCARGPESVRSVDNNGPTLLTPLMD